jgi:hypothetical protein
MEGVVFLLFGTLAVAGPLVLYYLVRKEHQAREEMSREAAERAARRDFDDE